MEPDSPAEASFAEVLASARNAAGLTQEELAERAQLSVRALSNLERGEASRPRRGTVDRLAAALGLTGLDAERFAAVARGRRMSGDATGPAQLPTDLPDFTGRIAELSRLTEALGAGDESGVHIVVLGGGGGAGKTALAVHAAHLLRHRYPDGQFYLDLAGSRSGGVDPASALSGFLTALGAEPGERGENLSARIGRYRTALAGRRVLVLLDDARDAAQVRPLLPAGPGSAVLVTSRYRLPDLVGARHVPIGRLGDDEATVLLGRIAGAERVAYEPDAAARVVAACDRLPLAVRIVGARLAVRPAWTVSSLADRLAASRRKLDELRVGDLAVRASFRVSYDRLSPPAARLFALLGHWPGHDVATAAAAVLAGASEADTELLLEQLVDAYLLESPELGRYRQHDLLHAFARELLTDELDPAQSRAALERLVEHLAATAYQADLALWPASRPPFPPPRTPGPTFGSREQAATWYRTEWAALDVLLRRIATEPGIPTPALTVARLASLINLYPFLRGDLVALERGARRAVTLADRAGDPLLVGTEQKRLGFALLEQRRPDEAARHQELALAAFRAAGAKDAEAGILNSIGRRLMYEAGRSTAGRPDRIAAARRSLLDSLAAARVADARSAQVTALGNLGQLEHEAGEDDAAYEHLTEALGIARDLGGGQFEAAVASRLGTVLAGLGQPDAALAEHTRAVRITEELADRRAEVSVLGEFAVTCLVLGRPRVAAEHARRALALYEELPAGARRVEDEVAALTALGRALAATGSVATAREVLRRAAARLDELAEPAAAARVRALLR
ncbi:ATP-binding protein [Actinocatenispora sera]|uniref:Regulatory protein AfsR n=1 Tax=Actinocatenispora sera TaxID=390989 RepID=A0A810KV85_9ACTN|nr:helix-turn-helix domain-containing protein [Actinocatenispora sera]BCJ27100.1 regulatory protein AfsR [Actinocatenispora sera]